MDVRKFWTACRLHDWFYMMSDDPYVYSLGLDSEQNLLREAKEHPALMEIYNAWKEHEHNCGPRPKEPLMED